MPRSCIKCTKTRLNDYFINLFIETLIFIQLKIDRNTKQSMCIDQAQFCGALEHLKVPSLFIVYTPYKREQVHFHYYLVIHFTVTFEIWWLGTVEPLLKDHSDNRLLLLKGHISATKGVALQDCTTQFIEIIFVPFISSIRLKTC